MLSQVQNMNALSNSDQLTWTVRLNPPQFLWLDVSYIVHQTLGPSTSSTLKSPPQAIPQGKKCRAIYCIHTLYSSVQQSLSLYYHRSKAAIIIIRTQTNQTRNLQNPQTHAQNKILSGVCGLIIPMCSRGTNEKYDVAGVVCFSSNKIREFLRRFIDPRSSDNNK